VNRNTQRRRTQFTPDNLRLLALAEAAGIQPAQILNQSLREHFRQTPSNSSPARRINHPKPGHR
jgi:hypothetical protein